MVRNNFKNIVYKRYLIIVNKFKNIILKFNRFKLILINYRLINHHLDKFELNEGLIDFVINDNDLIQGDNFVKLANNFNIFFCETHNVNNFFCNIAVVTLMVTTLTII